MKQALIATAVFAGLVLLGSPATAQTGSLRGKVVNEQGAPMAGAEVTIEFQGDVPIKREVKTNDKGEYLQVGIRPGIYRLTVRAEGYQPSVTEVHVTLGDTTPAPDIQLEPAKPQPPGGAELRDKFKKAVELSEGGQLDEAEKLYKEILEVAPEVPEVYENLAYIYVQKKDWPNAQAAYEKVLELKPGDAQIMTALASVYQKSGEDKKAAELMAQATSANPQDAVAQYNRGVLLLNSGDTAGASEAFEAALAADPTMAEAHYYLGTILVGQGKTAEAIEHLEKYLSLNPENQQNVATAKGLIQALKK